MDRYDPNEWTESFVKSEASFCMQTLRNINETVAALIDERNYPPAVAGLDRILNGLITFQNAGADVRPHLCLFSWLEAEVIAFGMDAPEDYRRKTALSLFEDARDFAKSQNTRDNLSVIIVDLKTGVPLNKIRDEYEPDFPDSVIEGLANLQEELHI